MNVYADSSFLVSSYVQDSHAAEFLRRISIRPFIRVTPFHRAEVAHAIFMHVFLKKLNLDGAMRAWNEFEQDSATKIWLPINLPEGAWDKSIDLARRYGPNLGVRALDSLHVACALELNVERFWTFDERQTRLAKAVGLDTNP